MRLKRKLLAAAICLALSTGHGLAMPTGGSILAGDGNISGLNANPVSGEVINFTGNGVIDWNTFNIAANESLTFKVVENATAFNYVSGGEISTILGQLTQSGGGSMVLCNPSGIVVGNGAVINANDLTLMTMQLDNDQLKSIFSESKEFLGMTAGRDTDGNPALIDIQSGATFNIDTVLNIYGGRIAIADGVFVSNGDAAQNDGISTGNVHVFTGNAVDIGYDNEAKALKLYTEDNVISSTYSTSSNGSAGKNPNDDGTFDSQLEKDTPPEGGPASNPGKEEKPILNDVLLRAVDEMLNNPSYANIRGLAQKYINTTDEAYNVLKYVSGLEIDEKKKAFIINGVLEHAKPDASADIQTQNLSVICQAGDVLILDGGELITDAGADVQGQNLSVFGNEEDVPTRDARTLMDEEELSVATDWDWDLYGVRDNKEEILKTDNTWKDVRSYNLEGGNSKLFGFDKNGEGFKLENYHKGVPGKDTSLRVAAVLPEKYLFIPPQLEREVNAMFKD